MLTLQMSRLGPQIGENLGFCPSNFSGTYEHPIEHNQFHQLAIGPGVSKNLWTEKDKLECWQLTCQFPT